MKTVSKTVIGALAATMLTTAVASPAEAQRYRRDYHRGNGISLGDVVLGTIAVAGVATVIGAVTSGNRYGDRRYDDRYGDGRYGNRGYGDDQRASIDACASAAEREAGRRFGAAARVRDIDIDVDRSRNLYVVRGSVEVQNGYGRDRYYDRRGAERVSFTCAADYGRVRDLRLGSNYAYGY